MNADFTGHDKYLNCLLVNVLLQLKGLMDKGMKAALENEASNQTCGQMPANKIHHSKTII